MATFFGEIGALSSRAVDDEEIDDQPIYSVSVDSKDKSTVKTDCKLVIFSVGELASAFVKCYLKPDNARHIFNVVYSSDKEADESIMYTGGLKVTSNTAKAASVYSIDANVIVCEISHHIPHGITWDLREIILGKINCDEALVLTACHMASFKSEDSMLAEKPFLKSLATSQYMSIHTCSIPRLQAPNFLSNFPAAILSEFEVKKIPAFCIINYVDSDLLDSLNVQAFESVLNENLNVKLVTVTDSVSKLVKYIKAKSSNDSNLYT